MGLAMRFGAQTVQQNVEWSQLLDEAAALLRAVMEAENPVTFDGTPVGTAPHVRLVVERYAELGVSAIIFPTPGPWDREGFRTLDESVIRAFEDGSP